MMMNSLGCHCGNSAPYDRLSEVVLDENYYNSDVSHSSRRSLSRRIMMFATTTFVILFLLALMTTVANIGSRKDDSLDQVVSTLEDSSSYSTTTATLAASLSSPSPSAPLVNHHHHHHHTLPTLLRLVDDQTGDFVYALDNPVYDRLLKLTNSIKTDDENKGRQQEDSTRQRQLRSNGAPSSSHHDEHRELPTLSLDRTTIRLRESLVVSWTPGITRNGRDILTDDHILALFCPPNNPIFHEAATLSQVRATDLHHGGNHAAASTRWRIPEFTVQRQNECVFQLYDHDDGTILSTSPLLQIQDATLTPTNLHMAYTNDASEMLMQFVTGDAGIPMVRYAKDPAQLATTKATTERGESLTYTADDLCQEPANQTEPGKFLEPGNLHTVVVQGLDLDTEYHYQVGLQSEDNSNDSIVWSKVHTFLSSLAPGDTTPFSYVVYGDQGCPSKGWGEGGVFVSTMAAREVQESPSMRAVHHFGDLSYAQGSGHTWDEWGSMIEPFAANVPLMVGVGNHEYDHTTGGENGKDPSGVKTAHGYMPDFGNFGDDSGGECGVPTASRFQMPQPEGSNGVFWYEHTFGMVHTIVVSSEHDLSKGSLQYAWLEKRLKAVDRSVTPWVVLETHRPLYESEAAYDQTAVSIAMRFEIEDLLRDHQVDVVLGGHYHMYQRSCDGLYRSECNQGGPIHITIGSAGANLDTAPMIPQPWSAHAIQQEFGYGRLTVVNATAMHWEFVKAGDGNDEDTGKVRDDVWILRDR